MPRKIVIDTDPGQDDAVALLFAFASPIELDILGVVTVAGNAEISHTELNALKICELADPSNARKIPVLRGSGAPLARKLVTCQGFQGLDAFGGVNLPHPKRKAENITGVDFLIQTLEAASKGSVTLCALGPLSNIARVFRRQPSLADRVSEFVLMGGAHFEHGNVTPSAEFNMHVDPEGAKLTIDVLSDWNVPITMLPLDVTHKAQPTEKQINSFRSLTNNCGKTTADILTARGYKPAYYEFVGAPLHDPCVIAYLLNPNLFSGRKVNVEIETTGQWTTGMTVVDWTGVSDRPTNVNFMTDVDSEGYMRLLLERIASLP